MIRLIHFIALGSAWLTTVAYAGQQDYPFKLAAQSEKGNQVFIARNSGAAPIFLTLDLSLDNAVAEPQSHIETVIPPGQEKTVATVHGKTPGRYGIRSNYKFSIGDPDAHPDEAVAYRLPFPSGRTFMVGQIRGGKITTHTGADSADAIDFDVPVGTPILAARSGIVIDIETGHTAGGNDPRFKANHVLILHEDGTLANYAHLAAGKPVVSLGQKIEAGKPIGYSGNTGYSSGPHLHFAVLTNTHAESGEARYRSHPAHFVNGDASQALDMRQGQTITVH